jgi:DNA polymerase III subunit delta
LKYTNIRAFEKHLADASPHHFGELYLILSKDAFVRHQTVNHLLSVMAPASARQEFSITSFDCGEISIDDLFQELESFSLFSNKRIISLQHLDKASKAFNDKLEAYLGPGRLPATLVISSSALSANTKLFKKIEKLGIILDIPEEKPWEKERSAQEWLITHAAAQNKKLDGQAAHVLIKQIGTDPALLHQELEKLICYTEGRKEITSPDIHAICSTVNIETIWQLGDAIFRRDAGTALRISKGLLDDGTAFLGLLRQIRAQFETKFQIATLLASGGSPSDVTHFFPYMKGSILDQHVQAAKNYGLQKLKEGLLKIDEMEIKAKNSQADPDILNEILMTRLTK